MSCTHFIVVSGKPSTDDLARGIVEDCLPSTGALSSYGTVDSEGGYEYHLDVESHNFDSLREGIKNHVAQFISTISVSSATDGLNLFFLDNPYGENDYDQSVFLDLLKIKNDPRFGFDNLSVWHIVLAYDMERPDDVNKISEDDVLSHVLKSFKGSDNTYVCYIGTQNMAGGATFKSAEHHKFHLQRMLADFMLLASDPKTSLQLQQAATPSNISSKIFSFGHSEYMYHAPEVKELCRMYMKDALLNIRLTAEDKSNTQDPFDTRNNPLGLKVRAQRLKSEYGTPEYSLPIGNPDNINIKIDKIIASSFSSYVGDDGWLGPTLFSRQDVHEASVAYDKARSKGTQEFQDEARNKFNSIKNCYENTIERLNSIDFAQFLKSEIGKADENTVTLTQSRQRLEIEQSERGFFRKIVEFFSGENNRRKNKLNSIDNEISYWKEKRETALKAKDARAELFALLKKKQQYSNLLSDVREIENVKAQNQLNIDKYRLVSYDDTQNLVNIDKLHAHFSKAKNIVQKNILELYGNETRKNIRSLEACFDNYANDVMGQYDHVNWKNPFDFIDFEIEDAYNRMGKKSQPYVHLSGPIGETASKVNTQIFVSAKKEQYARVGVDSLANGYQAMLSDTMEDKVCMIKVAALKDEYVRTLLGETGETVLECEVITGDGRDTKFIDSRQLLLPTFDTDLFNPTLLDSIPPRQSQLGVGFRLIREIKFSEAKEFFAKTAHDTKMAQVCTFLIKSRRLIDTIANGATGDMTDEDKNKIRLICEVFARLGTEYDPLNIVIERHIN